MTFPAFSSSTTAEEVVAAFAEEIKGKNVLITGTSLNGIGFEAARTIAKHAHLLVITCPNSERSPSESPHCFFAIAKHAMSNIRPVVLDLSSLATTRAAAAEINAHPEPLHVLINAAAPIGPFRLTVDGLESQRAVGHVGSFLLTKLLMLKLLAVRSAMAGYTPRVVYVSSVAHTLASTVDLEALAQPNAETYTAFGAYAQVKSTLICNARALCARSGGLVNAYCLHPGSVFLVHISQRAHVLI
ncbi:hypothetical protein FB451DRAFT_1055102 [Mycena latifolia]|nr:hypothetical protein FB451DRAFT_1055102 [Mycena latifolia]